VPPHPEKTFCLWSAEQECPGKENSRKQRWNTGRTWSGELPFHHHTIQLKPYLQACIHKLRDLFAGLEWCNIIFLHC